MRSNPARRRIRSLLRESVGAVRGRREPALREPRERSVTGEGRGCAGPSNRRVPACTSNVPACTILSQMLRASACRGPSAGGERARSGETHGRIEGRLSARLSNATLGKESCSKQGSCRWIHAGARRLPNRTACGSGETGPFRRRRDVPGRLRGFRGTEDLVYACFGLPVERCRDRTYVGLRRPLRSDTVETLSNRCIPPLRWE